MTIYINETFVDENVPRMRPEREKGCGHNVRKYLREYSEVTGIHGLRYVTEKRSRTEKVVWAILLILSLCGCIYMIYEILYKYQNSPVVVSFANEDTPLYKIPLPAITICSEARYSRDEFDYKKVFLQKQKDEVVDEADAKTYEHLSLVCDIDSSDFLKGNKTTDQEFYNTLDQHKLDVESLFPYCRLNNMSSCADLFTPVLIDGGICYSFNILGREEIFRDHVFHYKDYYNVPNKSNNIFDLETGYVDTAGANPYPRRATASGADNSFIIIFRSDPNNYDYSCSTFFQGVKVLVHNAWDVPRVSKHNFPIPLGKVVVAAMEPEMIETSPTVKRFHPEKRKCFMKDERPLEHFKFYTQPNCLLECLTNYTLSKCGCVSFAMPRANKTAICGTGSLVCMEEAEDQLRKKDLESKLTGSNFCDCKPSCTSLKYKVETSHSDFYFKEYFAAKNIENLDNESHWSVLQIYFKDEQFTTTERNELYGISDLISNLGGLLGLFTGFSIISGLEIIYFCSLRIFFNERMYGVWSGPPS